MRTCCGCAQRHPQRELVPLHLDADGVLAVGRALSVQVHPTLEQARAGFADEEQCVGWRDQFHVGDVTHAFRGYVMATTNVW